MKKMLFLALASFTMAKADLIPVLVGTGGVNCMAGALGWTCDYNYTATVHDNAMLTSRQDDHREFFTIYDFNGFEGTVTTPAGWSFTSNPTGDTPSMIAIGANDSPFIPNLTWEYTGAGNIAGGSTISGFSARSYNGPSVVQGYFSSQATHVATVSPGAQWVQNVGHIDVPNPAAVPGDTPEIPEPMTMGLMGSGLLGLGLFRRFRK